MPDDLRKQIIEAIARSGDENYKQLLMLLLRVEEVFIEKVDELADQLVPVHQHTTDHTWISARRQAEGDVKSDARKILVSLLDKTLMLAIGALAMKIFGA